MRIFDKLFGKSSPKNDIVYFPRIEEVLEGNSEENRKVFIPVFSVNLHKINSQWPDEMVHMLWFEEDPYNTETAKYFTEHCTDCRIGFDLKNGKYQFQTDLKYFDLSEDWKDHFESVKSEIIQLKDRYLDNADILYWDTIKLGGEPDWWQSDEIPVDSNGKNMEFIGQCDIEDKMHYLFFSPTDKVVVQFYQIT